MSYLCQPGKCIEHQLESPLLLPLFQQKKSHKKPHFFQRSQRAKRAIRFRASIAFAPQKNAGNRDTKDINTIYPLFQTY